jgi:hypothetical protein
MTKWRQLIEIFYLTACFISGTNTALIDEYLVWR